MPKRWVSRMLAVYFAHALALGGVALSQADAVAAATEVGIAFGPPSSAAIGPEGGEVRSPDGALTVTFPPGALAAETQVAVQLIVNHAPLGVGVGYRLSPAGQSFAQPVTLTFAYDDGHLAGQPAEFLWFISQGASGGWNPQRSSVVDTEAGTLTVEVAHFSDWAVGRFVDLKLEPSESVVMPGESVKLSITGFTYDPDRDDDGGLVPLDDALVALTEGQELLDSTERFNGFQVRNWHLNGVDAPVDNANGELIMLAREASYTAPSTAPNPNTVAVSVDLQATRADDSWHQYTLVANITVRAAKHYLTLDGRDGRQVFVGGGRRADPNAELETDDVLIRGDQTIFGGSSYDDGTYLGFLVGGATPGTHPLADQVGSSLTYTSSEHDYSEGTHIYGDIYPNLFRDPDGFCTTDGVWFRSPFTVNIDRIETDPESDIEVMVGSYQGTVYAQNVWEAFVECETPPIRSARLSGTFKLPVLRFDEVPGPDRTNDEPPQDEEEDKEEEEEEDKDLVPLAPPG